MDETSKKIDEHLGMTEQDKADLRAMGLDPDGDGENGRSLLRLWSEVLSHVEASAAEPIPMGVAAKVVASWPQITFQDTAKYHARYHDLLLDMRSLLTETINDNPGCADHSEKHDIEENYELYKALVISWNIRLDELERQWRAEDPESHIEFAALVDARAFLFSQTGFAGHLEARGFQLDSDEVFDAIRAAREETGE